MISLDQIRQDFPLLKSKLNGKPIVYLDSTASSLKPKLVIDAVSDYYLHYSANIFRGLYALSEKATQEYENVRTKVAKLIGGKENKEVVFVRNATEAINLVAYSWGGANIDQNSEIVVTIMEHHANFVPWQQLCLEKRATFRSINITSADGYLDILDSKLKIRNEKLKITIQNSKLLAISHVSNVLGTINPIKEIIKEARKINPQILVLVDGAQAVPHMKVNVQDLDCDFYAFSGHKMLGPTGIGVLWAREKLLEEMPPFQLGGEMIEEVELEETIFRKPPHKFEAGTPHIAGVVGLGASIDYLENIGFDKIRKHEERLTKYALSELGKLPYITIYGPRKAKDKAGVIAFNLKNVHPHDVSQVLSDENICIRSGHHCAMPLHRRLRISASCRASFYIYNTEEDIDKLVEGIKRVKKIFR